MSALFLTELPKTLTPETLLADVLTPEFTVAALRAGILTLDGLKAAAANKTLPFTLDAENQKALDQFLTSLQFQKEKRSGRHKKSDDGKNTLPPPNPLIVPLEQISLGIGLDGRTGTNRADATHRSLEADDDLSAIRAWLSARAENPNTRNAYRKEAERFLLWCTVEKDIAMSSVGTAEASEYLRWLEQLGRFDEKQWARRWKCPQHDWIGKKNTSRDDPQWRPFNEALSHTSRKLAMTVIRQLFTFLKKTGYIIFSPFDQISSKVPYLEGEGAPKAFADRSFTEEQWAHVMDCFEAEEDNEAHARLAVILMLGKGLGLRASEMLAAQTGWIAERRIDNDLITVIEVLGKGDKVRRLPLQPDELGLINHYLKLRDLAPVGITDSSTPILSSLRRGRKAQMAPGKARASSLSRSGLYRTLSDFFEKCAKAIEETRPLEAEKFRSSSTHWLRHTFATSALKSMPVNIVQNAMGHASVGTTSRYLTPEESEVARAMRRMKKK